MALMWEVYELLYGGARGGGKTEAGIMWLISDDYYLNPMYRALVIRKNANDVDYWVDRAKRVYERMGAVWKDSKMAFYFPSGAVIRIGHLADKDAFNKYLGHEYHRILIEELTQIANEDDYEKLISSCRSTVPGIKPGIFATTNPTGVGHAWVKARFVKGEGVPAPMVPWIPPKLGRWRMFIPATIDDNPSLLENDPHYIQMLDSMKNVELRKAWKDGNWDVGMGQFFDEWRDDIHVCSPFQIPDEWEKFICLDYGYSKPSAVYWCAIVPKSGKVYVYRELYVTKHTYLMLISAIARMTPPDETIDWMVADNSIGAPNNETGESGLDIFNDYLESIGWDLPVTLANKGNGSRARGWNLVREYMHPTRDDYGNPIVKWQVFKTCPELIRTFPVQMYDENNPEDLDTDGEDHAPDAVRYGLQAIGQPLTAKPKKKKQGNKFGVMTAEEMFNKVEANT